MQRIFTAVLAALALALFTAQAAPARTWTMDNYHSQAIFEIGHIGGKVMGYFNNFEGTITDPGTPDGSIDITIDVTSVDTGVDKRDAHLQTPDFFHAEKYPTMGFTSTRIIDLGDGWYEAHGTLTIKDVSRPAVLPFTLSEVMAYPPMPKMECQDVVGVEAHYALDRLDFGVGDGKFLNMGIVDDTAGITIHAELLSPRPGCTK